MTPGARAHWLLPGGTELRQGFDPVTEVYAFEMGDELGAWAPCISFASSGAATVPALNVGTLAAATECVCPNFVGEEFMFEHPDSTIFAEAGISSTGEWALQMPPASAPSAAEPIITVNQGTAAHPMVIFAHQTSFTENATDPQSTTNLRPVIRIQPMSYEYSWWGIGYDTSYTGLAITGRTTTHMWDSPNIVCASVSSGQKSNKLMGRLYCPGMTQVAPDTQKPVYYNTSTNELTYST